MEIAKWLRAQKYVTKVIYPGFEDHPGHEIMKRQSRGYGAMLTFQVENKNFALGILGKVRMIRFAESLGGVETLLTYPTTQTHADVPKEIQEKNVRIRFIGERDMLAGDIVEKMAQIEADTANNTDMTLCIALSYGSRQEIVNAVRKTAALVKSGDISINDIDVELFSDMLYTQNMPDPDLVIRTSGERRISNYLLWQIAYSEFYFSDILWPDFTKEALENIIKDFNQRERRYGKA